MPLPPNQQLCAEGKWPAVGERRAREDARPWTVEIGGLVERPETFTLDELRTVGMVERVTDIHCVTRWSKLGVRFGGVTLEKLVERAGVKSGARFVSLVSRSERGHSTSLVLDEALELGAIVALEVEGEPLAEVRGGPVRVVVPGRYFYKSLKWLERIELLAEDRLGFWESTAGYHNHADPWREERYLAPGLSKAEARAILDGRELAGRDLRSLRAAGRELAGLNAAGALLRDADFRGCDLRDARFDGANLSNARFEGANLAGASFRGADLEGADFAGADLRGACFAEVSLLGASFCRVEGGSITMRAVLDAATELDAAACAELAPEQGEALRGRTKAEG